MTVLACPEISFDRIPNSVDHLESMKTKVLTAFCVVAITLSAAASSSASGGGAFDVAVDAVVVRPVCVVATAVGSAFFVLSLPFAAPTKSVKHTAKLLVVKPARAAFSRPLGDLDSLVDE